MRSYLDWARVSPCILGAALLSLTAAPGYAGPCSAEIDRLQPLLDAKIAAAAQAGQTAPESNAALLHHQPTPDSLAGAESKLGEGSHVEQAAIALNRAREADGAGDRRGCEQAVAETVRALGP
jgi:hypothetical protein